MILRSKREVSRLQILVEIAEHQPSVRQQEIAEKLGVTPQAISEYIRELVDEGKVSSERQGQLRGDQDEVSNGCRKKRRAARILRPALRRDIIQQVSVWTAIAAEDLTKEDHVGVYMKAGFLYAGKKPLAATGTVIADAKKDEDAGVARLNGIIDHKEGMIHVCKVPGSCTGVLKRSGGKSGWTSFGEAGIVAAVGLEADIGLIKAGKKPARSLVHGKASLRKHSTGLIVRFTYRRRRVHGLFKETGERGHSGT